MDIRWSKSFQCSYCCMFTFIVQLEGKALSQPYPKENPLHSMMMALLIFHSDL